MICGRFPGEGRICQLKRFDAAMVSQSKFKSILPQLVILPALLFLVGCLPHFRHMEELPVSGVCAVTPTEVWAGEPVVASVSTQNLNPKHTLKYEWIASGGKIIGTGGTITLDTAGLPEDGKAYSVSATVSDPKDKNAIASCPPVSFTVKQRQPPTASCSAYPNIVVQGNPVTVHSDASSPQGGQVTVAVTSDCGASGQGTDASIDSSSVNPGSCNVTCTVSDDHQLTATSTTTFTVQPKPTPTATPEPSANLALRSVYFGEPTPQDPNGALDPSQLNTLRDTASEVLQYLAMNPHAILTLEAHSDPNRSDAYNRTHAESRTTWVKAFLVQQEVPERNIKVLLGKQVTPDEIQPCLAFLNSTQKEQLLHNIGAFTSIVEGSVDISFPGLGPSSQVCPFKVTDALSFVNGRGMPSQVGQTAIIQANSPAGSTTGTDCKGYFIFLYPETIDLRRFIRPDTLFAAVATSFHTPSSPTAQAAIQSGTCQPSDCEEILKGKCSNQKLATQVDGRMGSIWGIDPALPITPFIDGLDNLKPANGDDSEKGDRRYIKEWQWTANVTDHQDDNIYLTIRGELDDHLYKNPVYEYPVNHGVIILANVQRGPTSRIRLFWRGFTSGIRLFWISVVALIVGLGAIVAALKNGGDAWKILWKILRKIWRAIFPKKDIGPVATPPVPKPPDVVVVLPVVNKTTAPPLDRQPGRRRTSHRRSHRPDDSS